MTDAKAKTANASKGKAAKKQTMADIIAKKKAVTKTVSIQTDGEVADAIRDLRQQHSAARETDRNSNQADEAPAIQKEIDKLVKVSQDTLVDFVFKSVGRHRYDEMVMDHKPTKQQKDNGEDFNSDTFPPVLVSESCVEPEISLDDAIAIFGSPDWNGAELRALFFGALEVNTETGDIPLSKTGSEGTLNSLLNLASASSGESLTASM